MRKPRYELSKLDPGVTVATAELPELASVCVGLWFRIGSRYEPAPANGIYHFIEHMLFKGTRKRSAREITQAVEGLGGSLDAFTGEESTCIYARAHADHFDELIEVMMDMLLHSRFDPEDIEKEQNIVKEELAMYLDQPQHLVDDLVCEALWPNHPLGRPLTGTPKTIDSFKRPQLAACHRSSYLASNSVVVIAGNVSHRRVLKTIARLSGRLQQGPQLSFAPATNAQKAPRVHLARKDTAQAQLALGIRTCSRHDQRRYSLRLLSAIMGENMSSRLFQVVREDKGLAYSVHSCLNCFADTGSFVVYAGVDPDDTIYALKLIVRELRRIAARPPGAREFRAARDFLVGQIDLGLEGTENQMMWLGEHLVDYGRIIVPAAVKRQLTKVTAAEVQRAARDFLRPERASLAVVSPARRNGQLEALLRSW